MMESDQSLISVITATYNAEKFLPSLINSLKNQTDSSFQWIVADGGSSDRTVEIIREAKKVIPNIIIDSRPDNGISDAINRAIKIVSTKYYIILGADDLLYADTISNFKRAIKEEAFPDIIVANVLGSNGIILRTRWPSWVWLFGSPAKIASTAVGTAYKRDLNERIGYFDTRYKIYADGLFMLKAIRHGVSIRNVDFVAGEFYVGGASNSSHFATYTEELRAKLACGYNIYLQLLIFSAKMIRAHLRKNLKDI